MPPTVTIITVTYNRAHILPSSVESVLSQDYPGLRLLILDDGSTDGTAQFLRRYESNPRVEVLRHEKNQGVAAARNTALDHLGNDVTYLGYNDSDDMLLPGAISTAVEAIEAHGLLYSMVYAAARDEHGVPQGYVRGLGGGIKRCGDITIDDYLGRRLAGDFFQLVRRDLLGIMRHEAKANGGEGTLWTRIIRIKPALLIEDVLQLKDRSGSDRVTRHRYDRASAERRMWSLIHELQHNGDDLRQMYPRQYAQLLRELSNQAAMAGDSRRARIASRQALRIDPSPGMAITAAMALVPARVARETARAVRSIRSGGALMGGY